MPSARGNRSPCSIPCIIFGAVNRTRAAAKGQQHTRKARPASRATARTPLHRILPADAADAREGHRCLPRAEIVPPAPSHALYLVRSTALAPPQKDSSIQEKPVLHLEQLLVRRFIEFFRLMLRTHARDIDAFRARKSFPLLHPMHYIWCGQPHSRRRKRTAAYKKSPSCISSNCSYAASSNSSG